MHRDPYALRPITPIKSRDILAARVNVRVYIYGVPEYMRDILRANSWRIFIIFLKIALFFDEKFFQARKCGCITILEILILKIIKNIKYIIIEYNVIEWEFH